MGLAILMSRQFQKQPCHGLQQHQSRLWGRLDEVKLIFGVLQYLLFRHNMFTFQLCNAITAVCTQPAGLPAPRPVEILATNPKPIVIVPRVWKVVFALKDTLNKVLFMNTPYGEWIHFQGKQLCLLSVFDSL